jgi:hypothetical protein
VHRLILDKYLETEGLYTRSSPLWVLRTQLVLGDPISESQLWTDCQYILISEQGSLDTGSPKNVSDGERFIAFVT